MNAPDIRGVRTAQDVIGWLKAHPSEPFVSVFSARALIIGTRNDDGELNAYVCDVTTHAFAIDRRRARSSPGRGEP